MKKIKFFSLFLILIISTFLNQNVNAESINPTILYSCQTISYPGKYILGSDIINTKSIPCIKFENVSNISLDCQNHTITSKNEDYNILVKKVSNFTINNCKLVSSRDIPVGQGTQHVFRIEDSSQGQIFGNLIKGNYSTVSSSTQLTIRDNVFMSQYSVYKSNNIVITKNNFSDNVSLIRLDGGYSNSIISNTIDGKSDGIFRGDKDSMGADDGIIIENESRDVIQGNTIQNVFDCGIENVGNMFDTKIIGNNMKNMGYCMIGGWYYSSVRGNIIKDNTGDGVPSIFKFYRIYALLPPEKIVYFKDNVFENNKLTNPKTIVGKPGETIFDESSRINITTFEVPSSSIVLGNNLFKNNNFGTLKSAPFFSPSSMIVDGGGNICSTPTNANYPIKCNKPTPPTATCVLPLSVTIPFGQIQTTVYPTVTSYSGGTGPYTYSPSSFIYKYGVYYPYVYVSDNSNPKQTSPISCGTIDVRSSNPLSIFINANGNVVSVIQYLINSTFLQEYK